MIECVAALVGLMAIWGVKGSVCPGPNPRQPIQLNGTHVLRTWQPNGTYCHWWKNRHSESNQFTAAVPQWLVIQLRQPIMLKDVQVRSWDGQWQAAASVGSSVSALRASSLPLELQLQDPCNASWETLGSSGFWTPIKENSSDPISYIRLLSSEAFNWTSLRVTGCDPTLRLDSQHPEQSLLTLKEANTVRLGLTDFSSQSKPVSCFFNGSNWNRTVNLVHLNTESPGSDNSQRRFQLKFRPGLHWHGSQLVCCYGGTLPRAGDGNCPIIRTIGVMFTAKHTKLEVPTSLVNSTMTVKFTSIEEYPVSNHSCVLKIDSNRQQPLVRVATNSTIQTGFPAYTTVSEFRVKANKSMMHGSEIDCRSTMDWSIATLYRALPVHIVEPCQATLNLGSKSHWKENDFEEIELRSPNCNATGHSCELHIGQSRGGGFPLNRTRVNGTTSKHRLQVRSSMGQNSWHVTCRVNQSILHSQEVKSGPNHPVVFYKGSLTLMFDNLIKWSVKLADKGHPGISNVSCNLKDISLDFDNRDLVYRFSRMHLVCFGFQRDNGTKFYRPMVEQYIGSGNSDRKQKLQREKNRMTAQQTQSTCETLRLLLFATVVSGLISLASVIACATVFVRRAAAKKSPRKRCSGSRGTQTLPVPQNPSLLDSVPPHLRASCKTCSYYEDIDAYSQIGSCLGLHYINVNRQD